jgi:hypothetical protein
MGRLVHPASLPSNHLHLHPNATFQQLTPTYSLSLHSNYLHQRVADRPSHPFDIMPWRSSPLASQRLSPTHALSCRNEYLHPTSSRQALLSIQHCASAIVSARIPATVTHTHPAHRSEYLHSTSGQQALSPFPASRPNDCLRHIPTLTTHTCPLVHSAS